MRSCGGSAKKGRQVLLSSRAAPPGFLEPLPLALWEAMEAIMRCPERVCPGWEVPPCQGTGQESRHWIRHPHPVVQGPESSSNP